MELRVKKMINLSSCRKNLSHHLPSYPSFIAMIHHAVRRKMYQEQILLHFYFHDKEFHTLRGIIEKMIILSNHNTSIDDLMF